MGKAERIEKKTGIATFAAGCFWSKEYFLARQPGVRSTCVGFTGGHLPEPTYQQVCTKTTGHAEAVEVVFDREETSFEQLARYFFNMHDPEVDRSDRGGQYRSAIFYHDAGQKEVAEQLLSDLRRRGYQPKTNLEPAGIFWPADARHQKYCAARGMIPQDRFIERI